jgi:hypothetical protein
MSRPSAISTQASHVPHGSAVGPCSSEDARGRRLSHAARTGEHERLRQPAAPQRVAQRPRHRVLADDIVEPLRPPFARDDLVRHVKWLMADG